MEATQAEMTVHEYLQANRTWEIKHEWVDGELWAKAGGSMRHNAVTMNIGIALGLRLRGRPCRPTTSDQRVRVDDDTYLYPDVTVVCGLFQAYEGDSHSLINPRVVVEVLSPSTREYDIGKNVERYFQVDSVSDVLLVDPDQSHVIHHARTSEGWLRRDIREGAVRITGIEGVELPLDEVYADLDGIPAGDGD